MQMKSLKVALNLTRVILAVVVKVKRGREAAGKTAVFGILKRGGKGLYQSYKGLYQSYFRY